MEVVDNVIMDKYLRLTSPCDYTWVTSGVPVHQGEPVIPCLEHYPDARLFVVGSNGYISAVGY